MRKTPDLAPIAAFGGIFVVWVMVMAAMDLPAGRSARDNLRKIYSPLSVKVFTLKVRYLEEACGWYAASDSSERLRYLSTREGLWAEGLSQPWRAGNAAAAPIQEEWDSCMAASGRGHSADWLATPLAVAYLNAT